jgi:hypothetical protein
MEALIAVSEPSLLLAESRIAGCENCTDRAITPFTCILQEVAGIREYVTFVLPKAALCPMCLSPVIESTLVQLREDARELRFL